MGTKAVVGSLGLLALGTLSSGSFLKVNIGKNPFAGMSSLFSNTDKKATDKEGNTKEKKVEEKVIESSGEHLVVASQANEIVEETVPAAQQVQEEVMAPVAVESIVAQETTTTVEETIKRTQTPTVTNPVESAQNYGGGSGQSKKSASKSSGNGGFCVTTLHADGVDDISLCSSSKYSRWR